MGLTVGELKKALKGINNNVPVFNVDHDHSEWETNGAAGYAELRNQNNMSNYAKECLEKDDGIFKIKGNYFAIGV